MGIPAKDILCGGAVEVFTCFICKDFLQDPFQMQQCKHLACRNCLEPWLARNPSCAVCRRPGSNIVPLRHTQPLADEFLASCKVLCPNRENGCMTIIPYDKYREHTQECEYRKIPCPCTPGCGEEIVARDQVVHVLHCPGSSVGQVYDLCCSLCKQILDRGERPLHCRYLDQVERGGLQRYLAAGFPSRSTRGIGRARTRSRAIDLT